MVIWEKGNRDRKNKMDKVSAKVSSKYIPQGCKTHYRWTTGLALKAYAKCSVLKIT